MLLHFLISEACLIPVASEISDEVAALKNGWPFRRSSCCKQHHCCGIAGAAGGEIVEIRLKSRDLQNMTIVFALKLALTPRAFVLPVSLFPSGS